MKVIVLNPAGGEVDRLYQYDKGCKIRLYVKNAERVIIDYSCTGMSEAATVEAVRELDGSYTAEIPNYVLEYGNNIKCHIGYYGIDNRQIVDSADISVDRRTKPAGHITENPAAVLTAQELDMKKLDKTFSAEYVGKVLVIGSDGVVIPGSSSGSGTGEKGEKGDPGPAGPQGEKGNKGDKGDKGDPGATGSQGPKGDPGETGAVGPQGPQGEQGIQGPAGETGPQGIQGEAGPAGKDGVNGKSAYDLAKESGYTGTEADLSAKLSSLLSKDEIATLIDERLGVVADGSY